jgi:hypothetical protein
MMRVVRQRTGGVLLVEAKLCLLVCVCRLGLYRCHTHVNVLSSGMVLGTPTVET